MADFPSTRVIACKTDAPWSPLLSRSLVVLWSMNEMPPIVANGDAKQLREMARKVRFIAAQAVSERTRRVLQTMAEEYELRAARLESIKPTAANNENS